MTYMPKLLGVVKLNDKGQVVIPAEARAALHLESGDRMLVMSGPEHQGLLLVKPDAVEKIVERMNDHISSLKEAAAADLDTVN